MTSPDSPLGELMLAAGAGDEAKTGELFAALYRELHAVASGDGGLSARPRSFAVAPRPSSPP